MSADILNLRRARKVRAREDKERRAAGNRAAFGVPKAEREASRAREAQATDRLEAHRREGDGSGETGGSGGGG